MISAVIISYRNPSYLDLCLRSAFENKTHEDTEIIVVLDGFAEESEQVIQKYPGLNVLPFEENRGQNIAHNYGVHAANNPWVLLLNDDNVCPKDWDDRLMDISVADTVISPNQIEPTPSIFKSFVIQNFGKTVEEFQYDDFLKYEQELRISDNWYSKDGQTWPLFIEKKWFMTLGGIDTQFPGASYADHDFFLRCEMAGLNTIRANSLHFYHFARRSEGSIEKEIPTAEYFAWKWGFYSRFNDDNSHAPRGHVVRGIQF